MAASCSIFKNAVHLVIARGVTLVLRGVFVIYLARFLGPESYGVYFYAMGWYLLFLPFTSLGLWAVMSHEVGKCRERGLKIVQQTYALRAGLGVGVSILCFVLGWKLHTEILTRHLILIFSIGMIGRTLCLWQEHVFNAYSVSRHVMVLELIFRPIEVLLCLCGLWFGGGLITLAIIHSGLWALQAFAGMGLVRKTIGKLVLEWDATEVRSLLSKGVWMGASSFLMAWFLQGPLLVARWMRLNPVDIGRLALLLQVFSMFSQIPKVLRLAALPVLSGQVHKVRNSRSFFIRQGLRISWLFCGSGLLFAWWLGPPIVQVVLGDDYAKVGGELVLVLYLLLPWTWANLLWTGALSTGRIRSSSLALAAGAFCMTAVQVVWGGSTGYEAVWVAMALGLWTWTLTLYFSLRLPIRLMITNCAGHIVCIWLMLQFGRQGTAVLLGLAVLFIDFLVGFCSREERSTLFRTVLRKRTETR